MANGISIRIDLAAGPRIGPGKIALLEAIAETGSISAAARRMGMSYRKAWLLVSAINETFKKPLVTTETGGGQGGGAVLTETGTEVVRLFREIEKDSFAATSASRRKLDVMVASVLLPLPEKKRLARSKKRNP